jgi:hypothetical protein
MNKAAKSAIRKDTVIRNYSITAWKWSSYGVERRGWKRSMKHQRCSSTWVGCIDTKDVCWMHISGTSDVVQYMSRMHRYERLVLNAHIWNIRRAPVRESDAQIRNIRHALVLESDAQIRNIRRAALISSWVFCSLELQKRLSNMEGNVLYRGADKSLARSTSRCILFDYEYISFDASLVIYVNSTNIPPIMIINTIYETRNLLSL